MEFSGPNHFRDCMTSLSLTSDLTNIHNCVNAFNGIPNGCGCTRNQRAANASNLYNNLINTLSELEKLFLKTSYSNQIIIFKDGANILGQF